MTEIKIGINEWGTLFAMMPDGKVRTILIDVHDMAHYGIARTGATIEPANDVKPVVRCKDCRFREECAFDAEDDFFCASGRRKEMQR